MREYLIAGEVKHVKNGLKSKAKFFPRVSMERLGIAHFSDR